MRHIVPQGQVHQAAPLVDVRVGKVPVQHTARSGAGILLVG